MTVKKVTMDPKMQLNEEQKKAVRNIFNPGSISVLTGPAGTGKTLAAIWAGFKLLKEGKITRIVMTRPTVEAAGRRLGFLPGELDDKLKPYLLPLIDFCNQLGNTGENTYTSMVAGKLVTGIPLQFMRGMTFGDYDLVIADEFQNAFDDEALMLLTRMSQHSRLVITGDLDQNDLRPSENSGLERILRMESPYVYKQQLTICERSLKINDLIAAWRET